MIKDSPFPPPREGKDSGKSVHTRFAQKNVVHKHSDKVPMDETCLLGLPSCLLRMLELAALSCKEPFLVLHMDMMVVRPKSSFFFFT